MNYYERIQKAIDYIDSGQRKWSTLNNENRVAILAIYINTSDGDISIRYNLPVFKRVTDLSKFT